MIRIPEAKKQAEIIIEKMAGLGCKVKRGQALDLVANLQGFQGWNELSAASKILSAPPAWKDSTFGYKCENFSCITHNGMVEDNILAIFLGHSSDDAYTTLLTWTSKDGVEFDLRICGFVKIRIDFPNGDVQYVTSLSGNFPEAEKWLNNPPAGTLVELESNAYFEWIDEGGDPIGNSFDTISIDTAKEVKRFEEFLESDPMY